MFEKIKASLQRSYEQESLQSRMTRIRFGVIIGVIGVVFFILSSSLVNVVSFPQLKIGVEWGWVLSRLVTIILAIIAAAVISGWPTENYVGIVGGGVVMTVILMIVNIVGAMGGPEGNQSVSKVIISTLPMVGVCILLALALRMAMNKYLKVTNEQSNSVRRKQLLKMIGVVILVGLIPGIFSRFDSSALQSLNTLTKRLNTSETPEIEFVSFPVNVSSEIGLRYGKAYNIYPHPSGLILNALDTTIKFDDGYTVTCLLPSDASQFLVINLCNEGPSLQTGK